MRSLVEQSHGSQDISSCSPPQLDISCEMLGMSIVSSPDSCLTKLKMTTRHPDFSVPKCASLSLSDSSSSSSSL